MVCSSRFAFCQAGELRKVISYRFPLSRGHLCKAVRIASAQEVHQAFAHRPESLHWNDMKFSVSNIQENPWFTPQVFFLRMYFAHRPAGLWQE